MSGAQFVYVTYIRTTPEKLWQALLEPEFTRRFWDQTWFESEWKVGGPWRIMIHDGRVADAGEVIEYDPPRKLVLSWRNEFMPDLKAEGFARVTFELEPAGSAVMLTLTQTVERPDSKLIDAMSQGWPHLLASLKSLLETGEPLVESTKWPEGV
jgi:uncharacterized protein YndB with AHSA1/START domain